MVQRSWRSAETVDWKSWADRNAWTYQADASEVANRAWSDFDGIEEFRHLMTATLHDLPVTSFERIAHAHMGWKDGAGRTDVSGFIIVGLPARVAEPYSSQRMHETLRHFGADLPPVYQVRLADLDFIAIRRGLHDPRTLVQEADLFARYITMAPPDFWRH